jgi:SET domain-containing protein
MADANSEDIFSICPFLYIQDVPGKGRGVFTDQEIPENTIIEVSPVLVMDAAARAFLDHTTLHDYIFEWGSEKPQCCVAWGYVSLYNHSYAANCDYFMDFENNIITIETVNEIKAGEELTINYNGDWNEVKPVWFDVK